MRSDLEWGGFPAGSQTITNLANNFIVPKHLRVVEIFISPHKRQHAAFHSN